VDTPLKYVKLPLLFDPRLLRQRASAQAIVGLRISINSITKAIGAAFRCVRSAAGQTRFILTLPQPNLFATRR
jgi:hypothetical protein